MIAADQPTIFGEGVIAAISSKKNGNMKFGIAKDVETLKNREEFLQSVGISIDHTSLVGITYDTDDFTKYRIATHKDKTVGMHVANVTEHADALVVDQPNHALFLPLADCIGAILYDPTHHVLMVSHLGRHSVEQEGAEKSVEYLEAHYGSQPNDIKVWLSPGVGKASYPLYAFEGKSLHEVITLQLLARGLDEHNIQVSDIDTATSDDYYSHSEFLKANDVPGRFAIVAMMSVQGEPAF